MRKFIALASLLTYLATTIAIFSPMAFAVEYTNSLEDQTGDLKMCSFGTKISFQSEAQYIEFLQYDKNSSIEFEEELGASYGNEGNECGKPNSVTKFLEKGDCTAEGKVITEISEVIGTDTATADGENEIKTVYKGACCMVAVGDECKETRNIYTTGETGYNDCDAAAVGCNKRQWIIGTSGTGILKVYVKQLYRWGAVTVGFIAVVSIVVSGIQISISGVSGDITSAKNRIMQAIMGLVLLFLSGIILYTINPGFFS
jgi:hypothetical protein